jgi:transposase, IS30 family
MLNTELDMQTYSADPYSSWQRGTNEYANGLLRRYFPKRTDFRDLSQDAINEAVKCINNTPRKVLHYKTPYEVFSEHLFQLADLNVNNVDVPVNEAIYPP